MLMSPTCCAVSNQLTRSAPHWLCERLHIHPSHPIPTRPHPTAPPVSLQVVVPIDVVSSRLIVDTRSRGAAPPHPARPAPAAPRAGPVPAAASPPTSSGGPPSSRMFSSSARTAAAPATVRQNGLTMATHIVRTEGAAGLYRGLGMSLLTYTPSSAVWWGVYAAYQDAAWRTLYALGADVRDEDVGTVAAVQAFCAMLGGLTSGAITTPLDVVKTQLQVCPSFP